MTQLFLRLVSFFAQIVLVEGPTNGYGKVSDVIHPNAIGRAFSNEFRQGFRLRRVRQEDARNFSIPQMQEIQQLRALLVRAWVFGQHHVVAF